MNLIYTTAAIVFFLLIGLEGTKQSRKPLGRRKSDYSYNKVIFFIIAVVLIFVSSFRYKFIDTMDYRDMYMRIGRDSENVTNDTIQRVETGYLYFTYLLNLISEDSQCLLIACSIIINGIYLHKLYKYSEDLPFSLYLYFTLAYMGTMNGLRQVLAASICILFFECIFSKKKILLYFIVVLAMATFHQSAIILIPLAIIARGKFMNKGIWAMLLLSAAMLVAPSGVIDLLEKLLGDSSYAAYLSATEGMSIFRFLVASVPIVILFLYKKYHKEQHEDDEVLELAMNYALIDFGFNIMAIRILFFGRLCMYFTVFKLLLIPALIKRAFPPRPALLVKLIALFLYGVFFVYQIRAYGGYMNNFILIFDM